MDIQTITVVIAGISVVIGVINSILSNKQAEEQRQLQHINQIYERFLDSDLHQDYNELMQLWEFADYNDYLPKYGLTTGHFEAFNKLTRVSRFFSFTAELINKNQIDMKLVNELLAWNIIRFWEKYGPVVTQGRTMFENPTLYIHMELLYPRLRERLQQNIHTYKPK
jgi:hypothetical protein